MTKITVVTFGKGGAGKTTISAMFSTGPAPRGRKTVVIDFGVGLRNPSLTMGCKRCVVYDLVNVIHDEANLNRALVGDKKYENLFTLPTSQTRDKNALIHEGIEEVIEGLKEVGFKYIVYDSPTGIESGMLMAMYFADEAIVMTNSEVSSMHDSDHTLGTPSSKLHRAVESRESVKEHLLLTCYSPKRMSEDKMLSPTDIQEILRIKLIDVIPESGVVLQASNQGLSAIHLEGSDVANAYHDVTDRFLGKEKELRYVEYNKPGFLQRLFGDGK